MIPPMPTARHSVGVLSLQLALVVAGGDRTLWNYIAAIEIFKLETSQWYRTDPLPTACCNISLVAIGSTCYALGGYTDSYLNQALSLQLMIFFASPHQPIRPLTVVAAILSQLGRHYPILLSINQLQQW